MSERISTVENLVAAREARGLGPDDVVRQLKLAPRQVQALEQGDWAALPGHAFVRGMLRAYGRMLEVDVEPLVETMSTTVHAADLRPAASLDQPLPTRSMLGFGSGGSGSRIAWTLLIAVGVLALALFFGGANLGSVGSWLARDVSSATGTEPAPAARTPVDAGAPGTTTESVPLSPLAPASPDLNPDGSITTPAAPVGPSGQASGPVVSAAGGSILEPRAAGTPLVATNSAAVPAVEAVAVAPVAALAASQAGAPILRLVFERASWFEARRDGKVLASGTQAANSTKEVPIDGRTSLVIGNAANVRAELGGKPFDLIAHTRGSVARLSLP